MVLLVFALAVRVGFIISFCIRHVNAIFDIVVGSGMIMIMGVEVRPCRLFFVLFLP